MIPFRDDTRRGPTPWASLSLCLLVLGVFALQVASSKQTALGLAETLALVPARLLADPVANAHTLLGSLFLHAGWGHLLANLLFLAVFAPGIEDAVGRAGLVALFTLAGVAGGLAFAVTHPASIAPVVGASGAISGVMGATLVLRPRAEFRVAILVAIVPVGVTRLPAVFLLGVWLLVQAVSGLGPGTPGATVQVAWAAHLAGFAAGVAAAVLSRVWSGMSALRGARASA